MIKVMDISLKNSNIAVPILKRVFGLGVSGGLVTALAGAVLNALVNAILAARAPDWQSFSFVVGNSFVIGGIVFSMFGTIAFGVAGALVPHPKGSSVFRSLCRQALLGMAIGSLIGLIGGVLLVVVVNAALSMNKNAPFARVVLRYFDSITVVMYSFYGPLLLILMGLMWGVARGARQARKSSTARQQGAAPDRLQPALRSFLPSLRLPAAGKLGR